MQTDYRGCLAFPIQIQQSNSATVVIVVISGFQSDVSQTLYSSTGLGREAHVYLPTTPLYSSLLSLTTQTLFPVHSERSTHTHRCLRDSYCIIHVLRRCKQVNIKITFSFSKLICLNNVQTKWYLDGKGLNGDLNC